MIRAFHVLERQGHVLRAASTIPLGRTSTQPQQLSSSSPSPSPSPSPSSSSFQRCRNDSTTFRFYSRGVRPFSQVSSNVEEGSSSRNGHMASTTSAPTTGLEEWKQRTRKLMEVPIGSFDGSMWEEADEVLQYWIGQHKVDDHHGVLISFQLMERLSKEGVLLLSFDAANAVILNWRNTCIQNQSLKQRFPLYPSKVVAQLDSWRFHCASIQPDTKTYTMILEAAATYKDDPSEGVLFAESLAQWMVAEARTHSQVRPNSLTIHAIMDAWAKSGLVDASDKVEEWLKVAKTLHQEGWPDIEPHVGMYNLLLTALTRSNPIRAEQLFQQMMNGEFDAIRPDQISFTIVLNAFAKSELPDRAQMAEQLLAKIQEKFISGSADAIKPNVHSYTCVIDAWARQGNGKRAELVLKELHGLYQKTQDPNYQPDVVAYNAVIKAWARAKQPEQACRLLYYMIEDGDVKPNLRSFNAVLAALATIGAGQEAQEILKKMIRLHEKGVLESKPNTVSHNCVLDAWAKSDHPDAWKQAEKQMEFMQSSEHAVAPTVQTLNVMLDSMAGAGLVERAQQVMDRLLKTIKNAPSEEAGPRQEIMPNIRTWNVLLKACKTKGDIIQAERIFNQLKQFAAEGNVRPDIITYNTILHTYAKSKRKDAGERAQALFHELRQDDNVKPDRGTFLGLINSWIQSGNVEEAESALMDICDQHVDSGSLAPDRDLFHQVITSWGNIQAPKRAEALLFKMTDLSKTHKLDIVPKTETYNRILGCWAKSNMTGAGERAQHILRHMEDVAKAGDKDSKPDLVSYNTTVNAWASNGSPDATSHIESLVIEMILTGDPKLMPDIVTYGAWMKAILATDEDKRAGKAKAVVETMKMHNFKPNSYVLNKLDLIRTASPDS